MDKIGEGESQKREDAGARTDMKFAKGFLPMICGSTSIDVRDETLHLVVARNICASQHEKNATCSEHIWMLTC